MVLKITLDQRPKDKKYSEWDTLGFSEILDKYCDLFDAIEPPLTVGLYGRWGSGKTQMLLGMEQVLQQRDYITVLFDAWKYKNESNLILPIMSEIGRRFPGKKEEIKGKAGKVLGTSAYVMLNHFMKERIGIDIEDVEKGLKAIESEYGKLYQEYADKIHQMEKEFESFVDKVLDNGKDKKKALIIFVDNLDRCLPEVTINLLEDISRFFHVGRCIFVLAIDREMIVCGLELRYPQFDGINYLEKIIQIGIKMPAPTGGDKNDACYHFMKRYEKALGYTEDSKQGDSRDNIYKVIKDQVQELFTRGLLNNPRRIERVINKLLILNKLKGFDIEKKNEDASMTILLLILLDYFPKVYESLIRDEDFEALATFVDFSALVDSSPHKFRDYPNKLEGMHIKNYTILAAYKASNEEFYNLLKVFQRYKARFFKGDKQKRFQDKLAEMKNLVDLVG